MSGARTWPTCPAASADCWCARARARARLVTRIDPGVVSLVAELRGHGRRAAGELGQGKHIVEDRKGINASPAAITLALLFTTAELEYLE